MTKVQTNAQGKVYVANGKALIATTPGVTYPGLTTSYANGLATINKGALADYSVSDVTETGCIAKYGNIYNNFKIFGNPIINFNTGVISGFSYDNYIQLPQSVPSSTYCSTMDMIFLLELTDVSSMNSILSQPSALRFIGTVDSTYGIYIGSWVNGTTVLQNNKKYWFRAIFDGTSCKGYLLEDDDYVLSQLPDISQWSLEWTTTTDIFRGQQLVIGRNYGQSTQYFRGSINLSQAVIYVNGVEWWNARGYSAVVYSNSVYQQTQGLYGATTIPSGTTTLKIYYFKDTRNYGLYPNGITPLNGTYGGTINITGYSNYPSYSVSPNWGFVGSPTYNSNDMSYSGFSLSNYIRTNYNFEMSTTQFAKGFTIQMHIKTPSSWGGSSDHNFVFSQDGNWLYYSFFCVLASGKAQFILATGGSDLLAMSSSSTLSTNTEYWIRVVKPDTRYFPNDTVMQISTDGENWTTDATASVSSISTDISNGKLRVGAYDSYWYMRGSVYLDGTFIEFNNGDGTTTRVWDMVEQTV